MNKSFSKPQGGEYGGRLGSASNPVVHLRRVVMTTPTRKQVASTVIAGPSEMQMMMSLMRRSSNVPNNKVNASEFTAVQFAVNTEDGNCIELFTTIDSMERESGSGHQWNIRGYAIRPYNFKKVSGYYDSKTRKGALNIEANE